jgi:hypothetical protein
LCTLSWLGFVPDELLVGTEALFRYLLGAIVSQAI